MQTYNQTLGNLVQLKALTATDLQTNAYRNNFIAINTVEPSLGYPTGISNTNPNNKYFFPVLGTETTYLSSRRTTGLDTVYIQGSSLKVTGNLSAAAIYSSNFYQTADTSNYDSWNNPGNGGFNFFSNRATDLTANRLATLTFDTNISGAALSLYGVSGTYIDLCDPSTSDYNIRIGSFSPNNPKFPTAEYGGFISVPLSASFAIFNSNYNERPNSIYDLNSGANNTTSYFYMASTGKIGMGRLDSTDALNGNLIQPTNTVSIIGGPLTLNPTNSAGAASFALSINNAPGQVNDLVLGSDLTGSYIQSYNLKNIYLNPLGNGVNVGSPGRSFTGNSLQLTVYGNISSTNNIYATNIAHNYVPATSSIKPVYGNNTASGTYSAILGGCCNCASNTYSFIGGGYNNFTQAPHSTIVGGVSSCITTGSSGSVSTTIGGGDCHTLSGFYGTIAGGIGHIMCSPGGTISGGNRNRINTVANDSVIAGGQNNYACAFKATISGGCSNTVSGCYSTITGGNNNTVSVSGATINSGTCNTINCFARYSTIGGGCCNTVQQEYSSILGGFYNCIIGTNNCFKGTTISGGYCNTACSGGATIGGGYRNKAFEGSTISGGSNNCTGNNGATVAGGSTNCSLYQGSTVSGGTVNTASNLYSTVAGGNCNTASGQYSNVAGGCYNYVCGYASNIAGGLQNTAGCHYTNVAGGRCNTASGYISTITGGSNNTASGCYSNISGGRCNIVSSRYSFIAGGSGNDTKGFTNTFILGTDLSASQANFTYVNNLSANGRIYSINTVNKSVTSIGNNVDKAFNFAHNLNSQDVITQVYSNTNNIVVTPTIANISTTTVSLSFSTPPATNAYRVVVIG